MLRPWNAAPPTPGRGKDSLAPISAPLAVTNVKAFQRPSQTQQMAFCVMRLSHIVPSVAGQHAAALRMW
jgi:hypothetical protein